MTREQQRAEEVVKRMIVDAHRRGVTDSEGRAVRNADGVYVPPGTKVVRARFHKVYPCVS